MIRRMTWMVLLAAVMLTSGCSMLMGEPGVTDREVEQIKPHPSRDVTIVETRDQYGTGDDATYESVFWYCKQNESELQCRPACGLETRCPEGGSAIQASLAPRAVMLADESKQASKPSSDTSGETKAEADDGPAGAADEMTDSEESSEDDKSKKDESKKKKEKEGGDQ